MEPTKFCVKCGREKKLTSFYKNKSSKDGVQTYCKICQTEIGKKYYKYEKHDARKADEPVLTGLAKTDFCEMYEVLKKMGYDPNGDIHAQFNERHGFTKYKKRPARNLVLMTYQECLEIGNEANPPTD